MTCRILSVIIFFIVLTVIQIMCIINYSLAENNLNFDNNNNNNNNNHNASVINTNTALARLVKFFSKPGAFKQMNEFLGENSIDETSTSCPEGEHGLECRRAEARRSVDCPNGDCYCNNCAVAGSQMWASCCRSTLQCCSHLAAACRTCDHPVLYSFCSKHFKKCSNQMNYERKTEIN